MSGDNILLQPWTAPYELPPFGEITDSDFTPAFEEAMRLHLLEIEEIADSAEAPTFSNTIEALERAGRPLQRVASLFFNLTAADTNDRRQEIERDISPRLSKHGMAMLTNPKLFAKVATLYENPASGLSPEQSRLLERFYRSFVRAGAQLDDAGKARMTEISARLSALHTAFSQNVLADEKSFQLVLDGEDDLKGLPDFVRQAAAQTAADRGMPGKHMITLSRASIEPFLEFSERRDLREKAYKAYIARGETNATTDNRPLIREILELRAERARLLGFPTYADFQIDDAMAKTPAAARHLLEQVWTPAKARAGDERELLQAIAQREGHNEPLAAWDWLHFAEKHRNAEFKIDGVALKPYFELNNMIAAAFDTSARLFGLSFKERTDVPVYHPDVRVWEVLNREGQAIAIFMGDYFNRPSKRSGAWMTSFRKQERLDGDVLPVIVNVLNFTKGGDGSPSLLSLDDARTLFHEFGHALHGMLSDVTYASLSGTGVDRDFVELPSQLFENWLLKPETLQKFARHAATGQPIPQDVIERVHAARKFNQGFQTVEYTASALFDLDVHQAGDPSQVDADAFETALRERIGMPDAIALRHRPPHFQHIFAGGGYAAGYYTYMWAEVMEADAFEAFEEAGDIFDPEIAERLYKFIYSSGNTMEPGEAYRAFRGRDPSPEPLMKKRGLVSA